MPKTAFSSHFGRELDPEQLLALMQSGSIDTILPDVEISPDQRAWIRGDVVCSSCGAAGAQIVRTSKGGKTARAVRQSHFRFVSPTEEDAHHRFCEFSTEATEQSSETLIDFAKARSAETIFIRSLVCKGIESRIFDQGSIRAMRQWFFDLKSATRIRVAILPDAVDWMEKLNRHPSLRRWPFRPVHAEMPNFDWRDAAISQFTEDNFELLEWLFNKRRASFFPRAFERAKVLSEKHYRQEVFNTSALKPFYDNALSLAFFVAKNSNFPTKKLHPENYRASGAPVPLLALCALLLFVSNWNMDDAVGLFTKLIGAPNASDETLGNLIGLNPFHDYAAWETLAIASELAARGSSGFDYNAQLDAIELRLREEHRLWRATMS